MTVTNPTIEEPEALEGPGFERFIDAVASLSKPGLARIAGLARAFTGGNLISPGCESVSKGLGQQLFAIQNVAMPHFSQAVQSQGTPVEYYQNREAGDIS